MSQPEPNPSSEVTMTSGIASLVPFARGAVGSFVASGVIASVATLLGLVPFWTIYRSVDEVVAGAASRSVFWGLAAIALAAIVLRFALVGVAIFVSHVGAYRVLYELRLGLAERLTRVPLGYVTRRRSGALKKVVADDVERLELFLAHGIPDAVAGIVTLLAIAVWMALVDWRMALAPLSVVVPAFICLSIAMKRAGANMARYQSSLADMNAAIVELIRGMPVVKLFNRGSDELRGTEASIREHVAVVRKYSEDFLPLGTAYFVLLAANVLAIVPLGGGLNHRDCRAQRRWQVEAAGTCGPLPRPAGGSDSDRR